MVLFYEIIKFVYYILTIFVWLFFVVWWKYLWISDSVSQMIQSYIMPWYLVFCGLIIWYFISQMRVNSSLKMEDKNKIYVQSFLIWLIIWILFAMMYIFL